MQHARDPPQDAEADVDEEVGAAATFEEDGQRGEEDGDEVEEDVALDRSDRVSG